MIFSPYNTPNRAHVNRSATPAGADSRSEIGTAPTLSVAVVAGQGCLHPHEEGT